MANCKNRNNPLIRKGECNFMFAKNSKAYSVDLLFRFVFSLAVSMSTVLSILIIIMITH